VVPANADWHWIRAKWRSFTQSELNIVPGDGDTAKMLALRVRSTLRGLDTPTDAPTIRFASAPEQKLDLAPIGDIDARLKPIVAALKLASHRDTVTVTVSTGRDNKKVPRVGAEAVAPKSSGRSVSFAQKTAEDDAVAPQLAGITAGWALFTAEEMRPRLRDGSDIADTYGTPSQASYSAYLGAVESIRAGDLSTSRSLLIEAVRFDQENLRAALNLAMVELMDPDPYVRDIGLTRFEQLVAEYG
jgi:hypothetical protein